MFPKTAGLGAPSYLTSLQQSSTSSSSQGSNPLGLLGQILGDDDKDKKQEALPTVSSGDTAPPFNPGTLASLIALQGQKGDGAKAQGLFAKLDTDGDGAISKDKFVIVLGAGGVDASSADALFSKIDSNGDNTICQSEFAAVHHGHRHYHAGGVPFGGFSSLLNATDSKRAKTETATNADGSTTTTINYAEGSTVSMTTPAAS